MRISSSEELSSYRNTFEKYKDNLNIAGNLKNCLFELENNKENSEYKSYFDMIDSRQGSDWRKLYPELA